MKRVGNRLRLALANLIRSRRKLELLRFRQRWSGKFDEYECVGGPLDGHVRKCLPHSVVIWPGGYYSIDQKDCRLHFHSRSNVTSWGDVE